MKSGKMGVGRLFASSGNAEEQAHRARVDGGLHVHWEKKRWSARKREKKKKIKPS